MTEKFRAAVIALLALMMCSCNKPNEYLKFIYAGKQQQEGRCAFEFEMDLSDSLAFYATELCCRFIDGSFADDTLALEISLTSPSLRRYSETVKLPTGNAVHISGAKSSVAEIARPYRKHIRSGSDPGIWKVSIMPSDFKDMKSIYGIGFSYFKE